MILARLLGLLLAPISSDDPRLGPMDRPVVRTETLAEWNFNRDAEGWAAQQQCELSARDGVLVVRGTGHDPYFHRPVDLPGGRIAVFVRLKSRDAGRVALYWTTDQSPDRGEDRVTSFPVKTDGQWHDCAVRFTAPGRLTNLRLDPGNDAGGLLRVFTIASAGVPRCTAGIAVRKSRTYRRGT